MTTGSAGIRYASVMRPLSGFFPGSSQCTAATAPQCGLSESNRRGAPLKDSGNVGCRGLVSDLGCPKSWCRMIVRVPLVGPSTACRRTSGIDPPFFIGIRELMAGECLRPAEVATLVPKKVFSQPLFEVGSFFPGHLGNVFEKIYGFLEDLWIFSLCSQTHITPKGD